MSTLIEVFNQTLGKPYKTLLMGGAEEPLYEPGDSSGRWACIYFTRDYFSSALHEIAHWCVAGEERRKKRDYGYWYQPDGRSEEQQKEFEKVEAAPQALEWIFSMACGVKFRISVDNLNGKVAASEVFKTAVCQRAHQHCLVGMDERAEIFAGHLAKIFSQGQYLNKECYKLADI